MCLVDEGYVLMDKYEFTQNIIDNLLTKTNNNRLGQKNDQLSNVVGHSNKERYILVVFPSISFAFTNILEELIKIRRYDIGFDVVFSPDIQDCSTVQGIKSALRPRNWFDREDISLDSTIKGVEGAIVPVMPQNSVVKLSLGIQDDLISSLLWSVLWRGFPLLVDVESMKSEANSECGNEFLRQMMSGYIEKLNLMGVTYVTRKEYLMTVLDMFKMNYKTNIEENTDSETVCVNRLITEKDILNIPSSQKKLYISRHTIITPLARDVAKSNRVEFVNDNGM